MSETIYLSNVRLSFQKLVEAEAAKDTPNSAKKFGADLIMTPNDPQYAKIMGEVGNVATEKWKNHASAVLQVIQNDRRLRCYGQGGEKLDKKTYKPYDGYEGMVYLTASSNEDRPPQMIRPDGTICDNLSTMERSALARKLYGGCYVNAAVRLWPQDNQFGRAVRCELIAVQFAKDGEPFGEAPPNVEGMFGQVQGAAPAGAPAGWPQQPAPAGQPPQQPAPAGWPQQPPPPWMG